MPFTQPDTSRPPKELRSRDGSAGAAPRPKPRWRKLKWTLAVVGALLVGVYFLGPLIAAPILKAKLQAMVAKHLNAVLTMDRLSYDFPYGVWAHNAALVAKDDNGQPVDLLRIGKLELALAEIPWGDGPLIIEKVIAHNPSGHLIQTHQGLVGKSGLIKKQDDGPREPAKDDGKRKKEKPSDYFRLRRFEIRDGQIAYEDRRENRPMPWVIWKNLAVELNISPTSGSNYSFEMLAKNQPLALGNVRGQFDVDSGDVRVERFVLGVKVERGRNQEQLPPRLQEVLRDYGVDGSLSIGGWAHVPVKDLRNVSYEATIDLPNASAQLADGGGRIDRVSLKARLATHEKDAATREVSRPVTMSDAASSATRPTTARDVGAATRPAKQPPVVVTLDHFEVASGATFFRAEKAQLTVDWDTRQWRVNDLLARLDVSPDRTGLPAVAGRALEKFELSGKVRLTATAAGPLKPKPNVRLADQVEFQAVAYPRDVTLRPGKWDKAFTNVSGTVRANHDVVTIENVEAQFFTDRYFVDSARIPLGNIENEFRIEEIVGAVNLTGREDYPKPFAWTSKHVRPQGTWYALGYFTRKRHKQPGEKPDFRFDVRSDQAAGAIGPKKIPLDDAKCEITITPKLVDIRRIEAASLGGRVTADGQVSTGKGKELAYQGQVWVRDVDVTSLAKLLATDPGKPTKLSGKGSLNARLDGTGEDEEAKRSAADNFHAAGRFEVVDGDFWSVPVVDQVTAGTKVKRDALTAGQAAGLFVVRSGVVEFKEAAISAPVLGLQGAGTVAFDGALNLKVVAAPLADWKDQIKRTKIPLVSDVAGEVLGGLQKMINAASQTLLYEFRVGGTTKDPKIETVPTPVLTDGVAKLFGAMIKGEKLSDRMGAGEQQQPK